MKSFCFSSRPEQLAKSDWTVDNIWPLLDLMSYVRTDQLVMTKLTV